MWVGDIAGRLSSCPSALDRSQNNLATVWIPGKFKATTLVTPLTNPVNIFTRISYVLIDRKLNVVVCLYSN